MPTADDNSKEKVNEAKETISSATTNVTEAAKDEGRKVGEAIRDTFVAVRDDSTVRRVARRSAPFAKTAAAAVLAPELGVLYAGYSLTKWGIEKVGQARAATHADSERTV